MKIINKIGAGIFVLLLILTVLMGISFGNSGSCSRSSAPTLTNASVFPTYGNESTLFTFKVTYTDADGDKPLYVHLIIDGIPFNMTTNTSNPKSGMHYVYSTQLVPFEHFYYFYTINNINESTSNPIMDYYYINVSSGPDWNKPQLFDEMYSLAAANLPINFTIQYKDADNDAPTYVRLYIKRWDSNLSFKCYNMNITGNSYSSGILCYVSIVLREGDHYYYFTTLSKNDTVRYPIQDTYNLHVLPLSNNTTPTLISGSVSPINGTANNTLFTYTLCYQDGNYTPAFNAHVIIDGKLHKMNKVNGSNSSKEVNYTYSTYLPSGIHTYRFKFSNGSVVVYLPPNGSFLGPIVTSQGSSPSPKNNPPQVFIFAYPNIGDINTTFYFESSATDPDNDWLIFYWQFSDGYCVKDNNTGMVNITRKFTKPGNYTVTFTATDPYGLQSNATTYVIVTPYNYTLPKNNPPVIITNLKDPIIVNLNTNKHFSAVGSFDPDGDPLTYEWRLVKHSNYNISPQESIFKTATFNYTFTETANYSLYLTVSDGKDTQGNQFTIYCYNISRNFWPMARASVTVRGMLAMFSGSKSYDLDGTIVSYTWKVNGTTEKGIYYNHTYSTPGYKIATLIVKDNGGFTDEDIVGFYISQSSNWTNDKDWDYNLTPLGSHIQVTDFSGKAEITEITVEIGFKVSIIEYRKNYLKFLVESESKTGKLVVLDLINILDPDQKDSIQIKMDNKDIKSTDLENIIYTSAERPLYYIFEEENYYELLVYIPYFSSHTLEVKLKSDNLNQKTEHYNINVNLFPIILVFVCVIVVLIIIGFLQIRKKKEVEYYYDFRIAGDKIQNGVYLGTASEDTENWDDYI